MMVVGWDAHYDYVRLTQKAQAWRDPAALDLYLRQALLCVVAVEHAEVPEARPWAWMGYVGRSYGSAQAGSAAHGCILQASGYAADALRELDPPWDNVSRCDIALDVWYDQDPGELVRQCAQVSAAASRGKGARAWRVAHIDGYGNGDTTYLGARTSDLFIRIYDKMRESEGRADYTNCLRFEVELKGRDAIEAWAVEAGTPPSRHWLASFVLARLAERGVQLEVPDHLVVPTGARPALRRPSTESRLAWLENQVRPAIDKLIGSGVRSSYIRTVLGLD